MSSKLFFENYGRLLYAVANSDGDVAIKEQSVITDALEKIAGMNEPGISDDFKAGLWLSKIVFQKAAELHLHPSAAIVEFERFWKNAHHLRLTGKETGICIELLGHVARCSHGVSEVERQLLAKSMELLKSENAQAV